MTNSELEIIAERIEISPQEEESRYDDLCQKAELFVRLIDNCEYKKAYEIFSLKPEIISQLKVIDVNVAYMGFKRLGNSEATGFLAYVLNDILLNADGSDVFFRNKDYIKSILEKTESERKKSN